MAFSISIPSRPLPRLSPSVLRYAVALRGVKGRIGATIFVLLAVLALLTPVLFPGGFDEQSQVALSGPTLAHPFGTDELGRDLLTRSLYGLRTDLSLVVAAVPVSFCLGTLLGLSGAISERLGEVMQRLLDIVVGFPSIILGICIVLILGAGWLSLFVCLVLYGLPTSGRLARAAFLAQQQREYVHAARTLGVSRFQIMTRHILPNAIDPILVAGAVYTVQAIFIEASLSIVGLGIQPPSPSLGALLNTGMRFVTRSSTYVLGPTLILILFALSLSLMSDALNEQVNRR